MSLTRLLVPGYTQMLTALSDWLDKAKETRTAEQANALLAERLAPDMYPLATQVRFACLQAQEATFRLRGLRLPEALGVLAREGQTTSDNPGTMAAAQARISETLAALAELGSDALDAGAQRDIVLELPTGLIFDLSGEDYARDWALPQFYFHLNTAYAILRHAGVPLGKADYVPHMFAYLRADTTSQG